MAKLRYVFYELIAISTGLATLMFFGTLSFMPLEIMIWGEGQTVYWVFIFLGISIMLTFLLLSLVKRSTYGIILRIVNVGTIVSAVLVIVAYLNFTQDLFEPWIIQAAWFMRYNGLIVGLLVGFVVAKTIIGLSNIITIINAPKDREEQQGRYSPGLVISVVIIMLSFLFFGAEILLFRYMSLFITLLVIFLVESAMLGYSLLILMKTSHYLEFKGNFEYIEPLPALKEATKKGSIDEKATKNIAQQTGILSKLGKRIRHAGSDPSIFWYLFIPLLITLILGIIAAIIYPLNIIFDISFSFGESIIFYPLPLVQLFAFLIIFLLFFIVMINAWGGRMNRRLGNQFKGKLKRYVVISTFGAIDIMRVLGLFLVISQILYFYDYPLFFPRVVSFYLLFGVLGAGLYFIAGRNANLKKIIYIVAIMLLVLNFYLTYVDGISNASNPYEGSYDILFPFQYLHSLPNFLMVGLPVGIILCDLFYNLAFTHTKGIDAPNRAVSIGVMPFVLGMIVIIGNYLVGTPGGDPPPGGLDFVFYYFCLVLGVILLIGLGFNYLVIEILIPIFIEKKSKMPSTKMPTSTQPQIKPPKNSSTGGHPQRKLVGLALMGLLILSFVGGVGIYVTYTQTYQRPIVCTSPGNYYVWIQNSSERVSKNVFIDQGSPRIAAVPLALAKNEYGAVQLVWHPFKPVQSLSYTINDFAHQNGSFTIAAGNCSLRYAEFVLENEFPDVLLPFSTLNLQVNQNNILWFTIRIPYNASEGLYEGSVTFTFVGGVETIKFQITVWNFTIPEMRHLRTNIGGYSTDPERINTYVDHRINDYGVEISRADTLTQLNTIPQYTCYLDTSFDTWTFNWTWWDAQVQAKLDRGMNAFSLLYPLSFPRDPPIEDATWMLRLKNWLRDVADHLEPKGWLNYSYFYFIDEFQMFIPEGYTQAEYFARLKVLLSEMKNATSKIKIMATAPPIAELEEYIDIFCPISNDRNKVKWDELLSKDYEFWFYSCVGPMAPWPNAHLYNRLYEIRIEMWQVWLYNIHGFLFWSSTAYYHGHYGLGYNGYGDGWFIYEWNATLYDSIRWENFLEGQEDYEYLWLLNATLQYLEGHPGIVSPAALTGYRNELNAIVASIVGERWVYCDHVGSLDAGRNRIGAILNELGGLVNLVDLGEAAWFPPYRPG
jgi:hypothetical protein